MAAPVGGSSSDSKGKGKKAHKNKPTSKKYMHYKLDGQKLIKSKSCPRCGPGIFLANHNNRLYCGKCKYTEFSKSNQNI